MWADWGFPSVQLRFCGSLSKEATLPALKAGFNLSSSIDYFKNNYLSESSLAL